MVNKLLVGFVKWKSRQVQRWYEYSSSRRRWPGKFRGVREGSRTQFWYLPDDLIRDCIFPFLTIPDIVRVESLLPRGAMAAALRARLQASVLYLSPGIAYRAPAWLFFRKISPRKIVMKANAVPAPPLEFLLFIMQDTQSVVVESCCTTTNGVILGLSYSGTEQLRELDLRAYVIMCDEMLDFIRRKLTSLRLLHFALGPLCSMKQVAAMLKALPMLRDLGMHYCHTYFTEQQGNMIAVRCRKLASLTLSYLLSTPLSIGFLTQMAPNLQGLRSLEVPGCHLLHSADALAVAQHCGALQRLVLAGSYSPTALGFTDTLAERMHMLPLLRNLDVRNLSDCRDTLIEAAAQHCPHLQELHIHGCGQLTDESVQALIECDNPLTYLGCTGCPLLTAPVLEALKQLNPAMRICRCM